MGQVVIPPADGPDVPLGLLLSCGCWLDPEEHFAGRPIIEVSEPLACPTHGPLNLDAGGAIIVVRELGVPEPQPTADGGLAISLADVVRSGRPPHWHDEGHYRAPEVEMVTLTKVTFLRGQGCCEQSLVRRVTAWYLPDGTLLFEDDPQAVDLGGG